MAFDVRQNRRLAAPAREQAGLGELLEAVVAALGEDIRPKPLEHGGGGVLVEDDHCVDPAQRAEHAGPLLLLDEWAVRAFQTANRGVGVETDD